MNKTTELYEALLRQKQRKRSLAEFTRKVFKTVSPAEEYMHNWHIDLMSEYLTAMRDGDVTRLIINIPPRNLKSILVSVAFPAWCLGHSPSTEFMASSYSQTLSYKHSMDCRLVMTSSWYEAMFPSTRLSEEQASKSKFITTKRGQRFATSTGATSIGEGGDFLIVDDPLNPNQALSEAYRERANTWFDQSFYTRLNSKKRGGIVVIMQRLHEEDLTGHLLKKGGWEHLSIPAVAPEPKTYSFGSVCVKREADDLLHPEREGHKEMEATKVSLGSYAFAGQYQQSPHPLGGGMFKVDYWQRYREVPAFKQRVIQSWDTAYKEKEHNDYSVATTWLESESRYYLLDLWRGKLAFPDLKKMASALYTKWNPSAVVVEDKASGQSLIQEFKSMKGIPVIAFKPEGDKVARVNSVLPLIESGNVFIPDEGLHAWVADLLAETQAFPNGAFDDIVDSIVQALLYFRNSAVGGFKITGIASAVNKGG